MEQTPHLYRKNLDAKKLEAGGNPEDEGLLELASAACKGTNSHSPRQHPEATRERGHSGRRSLGEDSATKRTSGDQVGDETEQE